MFFSIYQMFYLPPKGRKYHNNGNLWELVLKSLHGWPRCGTCVLQEEPSEAVPQLFLSCSSARGNRGFYRGCSQPVEQCFSCVFLPFLSFLYSTCQLCYFNYSIGKKWNWEQLQKKVFYYNSYTSDIQIHCFMLQPKSPTTTGLTEEHGTS